MSVKNSENRDRRTLASSGAKGERPAHSTLKPLDALKKEREGKADAPASLVNPRAKIEEKSKIPPAASAPEPGETPLEEKFSPVEEVSNKNFNAGGYAKQQREAKKQKAIAKDEKLLSRDRWLARNGHTFTYAGIFLFTAIVYFRPYELFPALSALNQIAMIVAVLTLLIYVPTQLATEGNLTTFSTEIKCILFLAAWAVLTMPLAKDPGTAWKVFNESFSKIVLIFVVMVNSLRSPLRMKGLMWLAIGVGVMLSFQALDHYQKGEFSVEGYRVNVDFGGMFGNPNDMALHLVIFTPIAIALGVASKSKIVKLLYFASAGLMVAGNMVTQSRGGFLGLLAIGAVLAWKLGKKNRVGVVAFAAVAGILILLFAPGNYGLRMISIFVPSLDPVGSSDQRRALLELSLIVTLRNPQGIGIGNFPIVGIRNLQSHNAYTQVSSELGWLAFAAYMIFIISPLRKLAAIERRMFAENDASWMYYLAIGVQTSIIGYMVSSFFGSVAYNWYIYYPIAYAVCLRRIYQLRQGETEEKTKNLGDFFGLRKAHNDV